MSTYNIRPIAELKESIENSAAIDSCGVYKFKSKEKKGYFFVAPQVTVGFVQSFILDAKGLEAVQDYVQSLVKGVGKKKFDAGMMFSDADCTIQSLAEYAMAESENVRLTADAINKEFVGGWQNTIAYALVLERDAASAAILLGDNTEAKQAFWDGEAGCKFLSIAANYKQFLLYGAERKPAFATQVIKDKVLQAVSYLNDEEQLVSKLVQKLKDAPIASVDDVAL